MRALRNGLALLVLAGTGLALAYTFRHDLGLTDRLRGTPLDRSFQLARA